MKIALYPGGFKPPHLGHFNVVKQLSDKVGEVIVVISKKERDGITAEQSYDIWQLYKRLLPETVEIKIAEEYSPIVDVVRLIKDHPENEYFVVFGKNDGDNAKTFVKDKFKNVHIYDAGNYGNINATEFRQAIKERNIEQIKSFIPEGISEVEFMEKLGQNLHEIKIYSKESIREYVIGDYFTSPSTLYSDIIITHIDNTKEHSDELIIGYAYCNGKEDAQNKLDKGRVSNKLHIPEFKETIVERGYKRSTTLNEIKIQPNKRIPQIGDVYHLGGEEIAWEGDFKIVQGDGSDDGDYCLIPLQRNILTPSDIYYNKYEIEYYTSIGDMKFLRHEKPLNEIKIQPNKVDFKIGDEVRIVLPEKDIDIPLLKRKWALNGRLGIIDGIEEPISLFSRFEIPKMYKVLGNQFTADQLKLVKSAKLEEVFSKNWWSETLLQGDVNEIKIQPNQKDLSFKKGDQFEGKDIEGHRITVTIDRLVQANQIRTYEVGIYISSYNDILGHNTTKQKFVSIDDVKNLIKDKKLRKLPNNKIDSNNDENDVDEIKIQPNIKEPKLGDVYKISGFESDYHNGIFKIVGEGSYSRPSSNDAWQLRSVEDKNKMFYLVKNSFIENLKNGRFRFIRHENNLKESQESFKKLSSTQKTQIIKFIGYVIKKLEISEIPKLTISYDNKQVKDRSSFAYYSPSENKVWVYVKNRNMADILRSIAHELVHHKQNQDNRLTNDSGKTGSEIENEANSMAGVLLRDFGAENKQIYEIKIQPIPQGNKFKIGDIIEWETHKGEEYKIISIKDDNVELLKLFKTISNPTYVVDKGTLNNGLRLGFILKINKLDEIKIQPKEGKFKPQPGRFIYYPGAIRYYQYYKIADRPELSNKDYWYTNSVESHAINLIDKDKVEEAIKLGKAIILKNLPDNLEEIKIQPNRRVKVGDKFSIYDAGHGFKVDDDPNHWFTIEITRVDYDKGLYWDKTEYDNDSDFESGPGKISDLLTSDWAKPLNEIKIQPNIKEPQLGDEYKDKFNNTYRIISLEKDNNKITLVDNDLPFLNIDAKYDEFIRFIKDGRFKFIKHNLDEKLQEFDFGISEIVDEIKIQPNIQYKIGDTFHQNIKLIFPGKNHLFDIRIITIIDKIITIGALPFGPNNEMNGYRQNYTEREFKEYLKNNGYEKI